MATSMTFSCTPAAAPVAAITHTLLQLTDDAAAAAKARVEELQAQLQQQYSKTEPGLKLSLQPEAAAGGDGAAGRAPLAAAGVQQLLQLLTTLPHGPVKMSEAIPGKCCQLLCSGYTMLKSCLS
jgi:hypothetical protein